MYIRKLNLSELRLMDMLFFLILVASIIQGHANVPSFIYNIIYLLVIFIGTFTIISSNKKLFINKGLVVYSIIILLLTLLLSVLSKEYFSLISALKGLLSFYLFVGITFILLSNNQDIGKYWAIVNRLAKFAIVLVLIQSILYYLVGARLHQVPVIGEWIFHAFETSSRYRPSSIFSEPSHIAEFVLLSLYYYLYIEKKILIVIFYLFGLVLSTSGLGIVGGIALVINYYITYQINTNNSKLTYRKIFIFFTKLLLVIFLIASFIFVFLIGFESDNWLINRLISGGTVDARVLRSIDIFLNISSTEKLIGVGLQNQSNYINYYSFISEYDNVSTLLNKEYAQTLGYILVTTGIVGFTSFILIWMKLIIKGNRKVKTIILLFLFICLVSNVLTRAIFIVYIVLILGTSKRLSNRIEVKKDARNIHSHR